jgi:hypothetical protein
MGVHACATLGKVKSYLSISTLCENSEIPVCDTKTRVQAKVPPIPNEMNEINENGELS